MLRACPKPHIRIGTLEHIRNLTPLFQSDYINVPVKSILNPPLCLLYSERNFLCGEKEVGGGGGGGGVCVCVGGGSCGVKAGPIIGLPLNKHEACWPEVFH